ncbi:Similar to GPN3: GPN-loop GTPase 3 (Bos taurus) [Cotesia congregata]|uniref:GPN-loop GTPase 3 n=1 Tax=Cotesia congregata TaxID=51543 RepID=A0A8J2MMM1_COTCN|nr:Similar to GPN3: GPN-loop GTPase 3 (Bos taurus) [Cotesia congregata]
MRYGQLVMGPAGSGKSTYCQAMQKHAADENKTIHVVNLDPAAEYFDYEPLVDIRELISVDDVMEDEEFKFGPNGGLIFCMEYLVENSQWLADELGDIDGDYIIFDCPGQLELYSHMSVIKKLIGMLESINFRLCGIFLLDSQFMVDSAKFLSGTMAALSVMVNLEIPHLSILSKTDLLSKKDKKQLDRYLEPDPYFLLADMEDDPWNQKYCRLTNAIGELIDSYSLVRFTPLDITDDESISDVRITIDNAIQFGEDEDVKTQDFGAEDEENEDD